jgi:hypothetical protein
MVAFQWAAPCNIWTHGSWVRAFLRFQPNFGHALSHCQCSKFCPNLPKDETLKFHQKLRFQYFPKIKISMYRGGNRACFHYSDFQSKNFLYAIFIVKKWPLYVNFSIPLGGKWFFSQCSTPLVGMRFWGHVPNSLRNKNIEKLIPYLL